MVALDAAGDLGRPAPEVGQVSGAGPEVGQVSGASPDSAAVGEDQVARALGRASIYRILGAAFAAPSPAAVAALTEAAERAAAAASPEIAAALRRWAAAARASDPLEVAGVYTGALERPGGASPYEGSYGSAPRLAGKGAALADIAGFYAAFGLAPHVAEVEDHIASELEFMSALALKEAAAVAGGMAEEAAITRAAQVAFLRDHLGLWAPAFAAALRALTPCGYLVRAADLLGQWLAEDTRALGIDPAGLAAPLPADPDEAEPFACPMAAGPSASP
jgi:TorA maturation chaperone TorD